MQKKSARKRKVSPARARRNKRTPITMVEAGVAVVHGGIGMQVVTARKNRKQADIARDAGASQANVSSLERGKTNMSRNVAERIFEAVGIKPSAELADLFEALKDFSKAYGRR
jgi:DNA-binding XRE family transcriptional regulator